jgi:hypothetical protein
MVMAIWPVKLLQKNVIVETMLDNVQAEVEVEAKLAVGGAIGPSQDV